MRQVSDEERLTRAIIRGFKRHWRKILHNLESGKPSRAEVHYHDFEARSIASKKYLARRFYGIKHATKMVNLGDEQIKKNLSFILPGAINYIKREHKDHEEQEEVAMDLTSEEYILCQTADFHSGLVEELIEWDRWDVRKYPWSFYDDWYDTTFVPDYYQRMFILLKSTGEPFTPREIDWLRDSIIVSIEYNSDAEQIFWDFEMGRLTDNSVYVGIWELEREDYANKVKSVLNNLSRKSIISFLKETRELFESKVHDPDCFRPFCPIEIGRYFPNGISHYSKKDILARIGRLLKRDDLEDYALKEMGHILAASIIQKLDILFYVDPYRGQGQQCAHGRNQSVGTFP